MDSMAHVSFTRQVANWNRLKMCSSERQASSAFRFKRAFRNIFKKSVTLATVDYKNCTIMDPHWEEIADNNANEEILFVTSLGIPNHMVWADVVLVSSTKSADGVFFWNTMDAPVDVDLYQP